MANATVFLILLLVLADVVVSLLVLFVCAAMCVVILGAIYWYGDYLNSVTSFFVIIAVGLAVDSSAHIAHAFMHKFNDQEGSISSFVTTTYISHCHFPGVISTTGFREATYEALLRSLS